MSQMPAAEEAEAADTNDALLSFSDPEKVALGILKRGVPEMATPKAGSTWESLTQEEVQRRLLAILVVDGKYRVKNLQSAFKSISVSVQTRINAKSEAASKLVEALQTEESLKFLDFRLDGNQQILTGRVMRFLMSSIAFTGKFAISEADRQAWERASGEQDWAALADVNEKAFGEWKELARRTLKGATWEWLDECVGMSMGDENKVHAGLRFPKKAPEGKAARAPAATGGLRAVGGGANGDTAPPAAALAQSQAVAHSFAPHLVLRLYAVMHEPRLKLVVETMWKGATHDQLTEKEAQAAKSQALLTELQNASPERIKDLMPRSLLSALQTPWSQHDDIREAASRCITEAYTGDPGAPQLDAAFLATAIAKIKKAITQGKAVVDTHDAPNTKSGAAQRWGEVEMGDLADTMLNTQFKTDLGSRQEKILTALLGRVGAVGDSELTNRLPREPNPLGIVDASIAGRPPALQPPQRSRADRKQRGGSGTDSGLPAELGTVAQSLAWMGEEARQSVLASNGPHVGTSSLAEKATAAGRQAEALAIERQKSETEMLKTVAGLPEKFADMTDPLVRKMLGGIADGLGKPREPTPVEKEYEAARLGAGTVAPNNFALAFPMHSGGLAPPPSGSALPQPPGLQRGAFRVPVWGGKEPRRRDDGESASSSSSEEEAGGAQANASEVAVVAAAPAAAAGSGYKRDRPSSAASEDGGVESSYLAATCPSLVPVEQTLGSYVAANYSGTAVSISKIDCLAPAAKPPTDNVADFWAGSFRPLDSVRCHDGADAALVAAALNDEFQALGVLAFARGEADKTDPTQWAPIQHGVMKRAVAALPGSRANEPPVMTEILGTTPGNLICAETVDAAVGHAHALLLAQKLEDSRPYWTCLRKLGPGEWWDCSPLGCDTPDQRDQERSSGESVPVAAAAASVAGAN